jgi:hypothetical protein
MTDSGAGLLLVAAQGRDLGTQQSRALVITPGKGHGKGEFELFELVIPLFLGVPAQLTVGSGNTGTRSAV